MDRSFSHVNAVGKLRMVDVSKKRVTRRQALAQCFVVTNADLGALDVLDGGVDHLLAARVAGVTAAKRTSDLIPLCHTLNLNDVDVAIRAREGGFEVATSVTATQRTGVEMEALSACAFAALSIVNSLQRADPNAWIDDLVLMRKDGGKSGSWGRLVQDHEGKSHRRKAKRPGGAESSST